MACAHAVKIGITPERCSPLLLSCPNRRIMYVTVQTLSLAPFIVAPVETFLADPVKVLPSFSLCLFVSPFVWE